MIGERIDFDFRCVAMVGGYNRCAFRALWRGARIKLDGGVGKGRSYTKSAAETAADRRAEVCRKFVAHKVASWIARSLSILFDHIMW
jgi:hypothetical protein